MYDAPVLILVHGACLNQASWNPVRRALDPRWKVVAVDLPGHGIRRAEPYTLDAAAETIAAVAREQAPARVILAGDSLGGYSSLAAAARIPATQLAGLVVGGCSQNVSGAALRSLRLRTLLFRVLIPLLGEQRLARHSTRRLMRKIGHDAADAEAIIEAGVNLRAFSHAVDALAGVDFLTRLGSIEAPILFFNGDRDPGPVRHEARFVAAARRGRTQRFDCEHGASLWRPAEVGAMTNRFVEEISA